MQLERLKRFFPGQEPEKLRTNLCLLLVVVTAAVYCQVGTYEFLNYDDQMFVYENPHVYTGLNFPNLKWALTTLNGDASYWHPITWLSLQLDSQLFGLRPGAYHLTNLWLHLANSVLLLGLLYELTGAPWRSAGVAALFALHPLHIETVAWVSERKTLLCVLFWLLGTRAYIRYTRSPSWGMYVVVLLLCAASLMSKPLAVTLPFTLLLLDFWPLGRLQKEGPRTDQLQSSRSGVSFRVGVLFVEKIPLFLFSALVSSLTIVAQEDLRAISSLRALPIGLRIENALISYCLYLRKMLWPTDLAPIYPLQRTWLWWQVGGCGVVLASITLLCFRTRGRHPFLLFGWCWYLGTLVPVIGLIQAGSQGLADRYTYISLIGVFIMAIWGLAAAAEHSAGARGCIPAGGFACLLVAVFAISTGWQTRYWENSIKLFEHAVRATGQNPLAYHNLGLAFEAKGNAAESEYNLREAIRIRPGLAVAHATLGEILFKKGDVAGAIEEHDIALKINPDDPENHASLANLYVNAPSLRFRDPALAVEHARRACEVTHYRQRRFLVLLAGTCLVDRQYQRAADAAQRARAQSVTRVEQQDSENLIAKISQLQFKETKK